MMKWLKMRQMNQPSIPEIRNTQGFTLAEVLVVTIIIGILAAIVGPSWFGFLERQRLNTEKNTVFQGLREAQNLAKRERDNWQFTIQQGSNNVQWRVDESEDNICTETSGWSDLKSQITIDTNNTTLDTPNNINDCWRVRFNERGGVNVSATGTLTLSTENIDAKRCIIVSTILGAMRDAQGDECEP